MGDPNNISVEELKRALNRWRVPPQQIEACFEKSDLVRLYKQHAEIAAARNAQRERERARTAAGATSNTSSSSSYSSGGPGMPNIGWQNYALGSLLLLFALQYMGIIGDGQPSGGNHAEDEVSFNLADKDSYSLGKVAEVATLQEFNSALALHKDGTGLPVVVDFFSHSCGPCVQIAPTYRKYAKEFKGRAVFLKVDVNRNRQTSAKCQIRAMPTFQFYVGGKKVHEFSGADGRRLYSVTAELADQAEKKGTYVGKEVTAASLITYYTKNDPSKINEVSKVAEKYGTKTAKLVRLLRKKYGKVPIISDVKNEEDEDEGEGEGVGVGEEDDEKSDSSKSSKKRKEKRKKKKKKRITLKTMVLVLVLQLPPRWAVQRWQSCERHCAIMPTRERKRTRKKRIHSCFFFPRKEQQLQIQPKLSFLVVDQLV